MLFQNRWDHHTFGCQLPRGLSSVSQGPGCWQHHHPISSKDSSTVLKDWSIQEGCGFWSVHWQHTVPVAAMMAYLSWCREHLGALFHFENGTLLMLACFMLIVRDALESLGEPVACRARFLNWSGYHNSRERSGGFPDQGIGEMGEWCLYNYMYTFYVSRLHEMTGESSQNSSSSLKNGTLEYIALCSFFNELLGPA